jgi:hypothetical protein
MEEDNAELYLTGRCIGQSVRGLSSVSSSEKVPAHASRFVCGTKERGGRGRTRWAPC